MKNFPFRKVILVPSIIILSLILIAFTFRDLLVSAYLKGKIDSFNKTHHAGLKIRKIKVQWLSTLTLTGITVKPEEADTLLKADTISISINMLKLLTGRIVIQGVTLANVTCSLNRKGQSNNYDFLFKKQEEPSDTVKKAINYAYAADRLAGFIFDKIPRRMSVRNLELSVNSNGHLVIFRIDRFFIREHIFRIPVTITENDSSQLWTLSGSIDHASHFAAVSITSRSKQKAFIPVITNKWNATAAFDTVFFSLLEKSPDDSITSITGSAFVKGLDFDHSSVSQKMISIDKIAFDYSVKIGPGFAELDSSGSVVINSLDLHPYVRITSRPAKQLILRLNKPDFPAADLFSSLPAGLFSNLDGIEVKGELSYYLDFFVDLSMPDSLRFTSELKQHQFRVISYGNNDLAKFNGSFPYTAYEKGMPVKTFIVGPENPDFTPLARISPYLKSSVLTSEDPGFFLHRGFIPDAFRESIITDIKDRKFTRGGSTISMQLVKNVFLNRNKTIARKLEEILLTWLIESQGLSTKERMFEVYLNIIEWGPLIHGAKDAARFYFNKAPSRLTLAESIFLASIIPKPKWFKYSFDDSGHLRESQAAYFNLLSQKMLNRGLISRQDFDHLVPDVTLKGPARLLLKKNDTVPADTAAYEEDL